jgi:hypothetical protein
LAQPGIDPPVRDGSRFGYPSYELLLIHRIVAKIALAKQSGNLSLRGLSVLSALRVHSLLRALGALRALGDSACLLTDVRTTRI